MTRAHGALVAGWNCGVCDASEWCTGGSGDNVQRWFVYRNKVRATASLDLMSPEERRHWSAELMTEECLRRGLPLLASDEQHWAVAAIMAGSADEREVACGRWVPKRDWLTISEVADIIRTPQSSLYGWAKVGTLPEAVQLGSWWRVNYPRFERALLGGQPIGPESNGDWPGSSCGHWPSSSPTMRTTKRLTNDAKFPSTWRQQPLTPNRLGGPGRRSGYRSHRRAAPGDVFERCPVSWRAEGTASLARSTRG